MDIHPPGSSFSCLSFQIVRYSLFCSEEISATEYAHQAYHPPPLSVGEFPSVFYALINFPRHLSQTPHRSQNTSRLLNPEAKIAVSSMAPTPWPYHSANHTFPGSQCPNSYWRSVSVYQYIAGRRTQVGNRDDEPSSCGLLLPRRRSSMPAHRSPGQGHLPCWNRLVTCRHWSRTGRFMTDETLAPCPLVTAGSLCFVFLKCSAQHSLFAPMRIRAGWFCILCVLFYVVREKACLDGGGGGGERTGKKRG